jgi:hypothetical protein
MFLLTILYLVVFIQIVRTIFDPSGIWYKDPKFWIQLITVLFLSFISFV